jgi:hypothetical protein
VGGGGRAAGRRTGMVGQSFQSRSRA